MHDYKIKDMIVHPTHGIGQIIAIRHEELVEGFEHFYVIEIADSDLKIHVPMRKMSVVGVRPIMLDEDYATMVNALGGTPKKLSPDYKLRQKDIREALSSGEPTQFAESVRDLTEYGRRAKLTKADNDLLVRGRNLLIEEMMVVKNIKSEVAIKLVDKALADSALLSEDIELD